VLSLLIASVEGSSRGSSGIGPVVIAVGLTITSALVLTFVIRRMPGSNENTGAGPFSRRRRTDPLDPPPQDPWGRPPRDSFGD